MNYIFRTMNFCLATATACLLFIALLFNTHTGLLYSVELAKMFIPGSLWVSDIRGTWVDGIDIGRLKYKDRNSELSAQHIQLLINWKELNLLAQWRTLRINQLPDLQTGKLYLLFNQGDLSIKGTTLYADQKIEADIILPKLKKTPAHIQGHIQCNLPSLTFLEKIYPDIQQIKGQLNSVITLSGALKNPLIETKIQLKDASFYIPAKKLYISPVNLELTGKNMDWKLKGHINPSGQLLTIKGHGKFSKNPKGFFHLSGENLLLTENPDLYVRISPNIDVEISREIAKVTGDIYIPKASITPQNFTESTHLSSDAVFVDRSPPPSHPIDLNVRLIAGENVEINIKGLQGRLKGEVKFIQTPGKPSAAFGELLIQNGKYEAYGQKLSLNQGQLLFTGKGPENPEIHLRAERQFKNNGNRYAATNTLVDFGGQITAGIEVSGRLSHPKVELFSIPANLMQADILSLLILGKPASQVGESGGQLLWAAASALNLNSGGKGMQLLQQLKQKAGLDFSFETDQKTDKRSVMIGKSLSKKLYLSYNMGLSQNNNMFTLTWLFNQFVSLQVNTSETGSGIDVLYTR